MQTKYPCPGMVFPSVTAALPCAALQLNAEVCGHNFAIVQDRWSPIAVFHVIRISVLLGICRDDLNLLIHISDKFLVKFVASFVPVCRKEFSSREHADDIVPTASQFTILPPCGQFAFPELVTMLNSRSRYKESSICLYSPNQTP